jgi:glutaredoxin
MRILLLFLLLALTAEVSAQSVYQWTDAKGVVHFGDKPPANGTARQVQIDPVPASVLQQSRLKVVMFATKSCGFCAQARRYFAQRGITYAERDIDASAAANTEWKRLGGKGVPLFVINGRVSQGFDAETMSQKLKPFLDVAQSKK